MISYSKLKLVIQGLNMSFKARILKLEIARTSNPLYSKYRMRQVLLTCQKV